MTPVVVTELTTVVEASERPVTGPAAPEPAPPWEELERVRRAEAELARDRARVRAEGLDA